MTPPQFAFAIRVGQTLNKSMRIKTSFFASLSLAMLLATSVSAAPKIPGKYKQNGFAIGCQAYTFKQFTVFEAIEKTAQAGGKVIEFFPGQKLSKEKPDVKWDHHASDEVIAEVKAKLKKEGVLAVNYGVVPIPADETEARQIFEFAKKLGLRAVTTEAVNAIDTIEKLVKEYDIMVAFHDHPKRPNQPDYKMWDPHYILSVVEKRDKRIGACADTGHWVRSGLVPVDCLKILEGRIISSHLKDLNEFGKVEAHDLPYGQGVSDVNAILKELKRQKFDGNISVEYEYHWDNSLPEVKQCIDYVRHWKK